MSLLWCLICGTWRYCLQDFTVQSLHSLFFSEEKNLPWISYIFVSFRHWIFLFFKFSPLVCVLFVSAFLWLPLSRSLCSVKHGQRTTAEQPWWVRCRQLKNILLTWHPMGFISQAVIPKSNLLYSLHYFPHYFFTFHSAQITFLFVPMFCSPDFECKCGSQFVFVSWLPTRPGSISNPAKSKEQTFECRIFITVTFLVKVADYINCS